MNPKLLLRIAFGFILFFLLGHSFGHFSWSKTDDPVKKEVIRQMNEHKFEFGGSVKSIGEHYIGYSWILIFTLIAFAVQVWIISGLTEKDPAGASKVLIPVFIAFLAMAIFAYLFFFLLPAVTCLIVSALVLVSIIRLSKA